MIKALTAAVGISVGQPASWLPAAAAVNETNWTVQTLEAFADTLVPGERRFSGDVPIAGVVQGPGAVQAGAVQVLQSPDLPLFPFLPGIAALLNTRATAYAAIRLIWLPVTRPAFVGLSFAHRTALVSSLFDANDLDRQIWQMLSLLTSLAFDSASHLDTSAAVEQHHSGLAWLGFPPPDTDGLWRFSQFSYGRALADLHPKTTASGSPA
ncbi:DUF5987 family protein [Streptomyces sp. NBC_01077]|uniref:DUF5987 family protein n=1 Tax=Streptomyces sp. NBC_01077 TaxID=2903746 RepID=UPI00386570C4|nr:DUF5987 family protein [Streptomyces sp. NBC_01077]WSV43696.1 DUF5987 family protein [Streptomyces sp. NBC_01077]